MVGIGRMDGAIMYNDNYREKKEVVVRNIVARAVRFVIESGEFVGGGGGIGGERR